MKLYTKTGDKGKTGLIGGTRVNKNDKRLNAYGTVDELNSFIGLLASHLNEDKENHTFLQNIQHDLFVIGAHLATDKQKVSAENTQNIKKNRIETLEKEIDRLTETVEPLSSFILPGGTTESSISHVCRTVTRRAERCLYELIEENEDVNTNILMYINRLSDYFFILARYLNKKGNKSDFFWRKE